MPARVLIADDVESMRELLRMIVEADERFVIVGEAGDGFEAVDLARQMRPDVVLLDLAMPRMDGLTAIPFIHDAAPGVRILVLSGFESPELAEVALAQCASAFLSKGAPPKRITSTLHSVYSSPPKRSCAASA